MDLWSALFDVLVLLFAAFVLGAVCERFRQSAILGYLLAGTLLGPNTLNFISNEEEVKAVAELGVALLLFTIGLEFSWHRLRQMGAVAFGGGTLQVLVTMALAGGTAFLLGLGVSEAIVVGAVLALSSTATVLRILMVRAEFESIHGRQALGILLLQDIAVVPLVLLVSVLGGKEEGWGILLLVAKMVGIALALVLVFYFVFNKVIPHILDTGPVRRNRELPTLLAVVMGLGSAWATHKLGLSPAFGAFVAGMLLAESPFATQIRADVISLRTLLMTLFFSSIGMLGDPVWIARNWTLVIGLVLGITIGKAFVVWAILRLFRQTHVNALAAGICLAQVGEFSFVLAEVARGQVIGEELFSLIVSATIITLFLTPFFVAMAPRFSSFVGRTVLKEARLARQEGSTGIRNPVLIVGFGPAGQAVGEALQENGIAASVVDHNRKLVELAKSMGLHGQVGDATHADVLEHMHVASASIVAITIPDRAGCRTIIRLVKSLSPRATIVVRARYHAHRLELEQAGAHVVVDEEEQIGSRIAGEVLSLRTPPQ